jgi:hypothetical protein
LGYDKSQPGEMQIPLLRVTKNRIGSTLLRYLISKAIFDSRRDGLRIIRIAETCQSDLVGGAAREAGFFSSIGAWVKINLEHSGTAGEVQNQLERLANSYGAHATLCQQVRSALAEAAESRDVEILSELEHVLWPVKILDTEIPCYVIPIKPQWAQGLFDEGLARTDLLGAEEHLALNRESVYYRAPKNPRTLPVPARILWYVSSGATYPEAKSIRACSRLVEVALGGPKVLFGRFKRLGIYEWKDVERIARRDSNGQVMALRFDDTDLFPKPLPLASLVNILAEAGHSFNNVQGPMQVRSDVFQKVISYCTGQP